MEASTEQGELRFGWIKTDAGYSWEWVEWNRLMFADETLRQIIDEDGNYDEEEGVLVPSPESRSHVVTRPLEDNPDLFLKFGETEPTEEGILAFANEHGLLENKTRLNPREGFYPWQEIGPPVVLLAKWKKEIKEMADTVYLLGLIKDGDNSRLSEIVSVKGDRVFDDQMLSGYRMVPGIEDRMLPGDFTVPAAAVLTFRFNDKLGDNPVEDRLRLNANNEIEGFRRPGSLLSAMWLQFYYYVTGLADFKRCLICGKWEAMYNPDGTKRHNENWKMHSECAAKKRAAEQYKRKKEKAAKAAKKPAGKKAKPKAAKKPAEKKAARGGKK